jgi:lipoprotein-releasing system permease protein
MYIFLLALRYLRARYIALASIISVTLGVATLIVVNSVMDGFSQEMRRHLHDILSDIEVAAAGVGEMENPAAHKQRIREICGDDLQALTEVVRVPAMVHIDWRGRMINQQILLIGIDDETYAKVSDFRPYLLNAHLSEKVSFELQEDGYDQRLGNAGWEHRRQKIATQRNYERMMREAYMDPRDAEMSTFNETSNSDQPIANQPGKINLRPLPAMAPGLQATEPAGINSPEDQIAAAQAMMPAPLDSRAKIRPVDENIFDPMVQQHSGIIMGIAIASRKVKDPETGVVTDAFLCQPGDDVQISFPTVGSPPKIVADACTIVDFYESKMHEYDSNFAFMPLSKLQQARHMVGQDGAPTASAILIKMKPGADLEATRDKLIAEFPPAIFAYNIQTWKDTQGPLLQAAELELTILNILLFLIIAVAGFGILATFFMIVVEKTKDIGIMKSLGASSQGVMSIFLGYGCTLGLVGSGVGIVAGLLFVVYINDIADLVAIMTGKEVFDPSIYYFTEIPTIIDPVTICWVAVGATLIAVCASVLPAIRAARLHPVEALRYE